MVRGKQANSRAGGDVERDNAAGSLTRAGVGEESAPGGPRPWRFAAG